MELKGIWIDDPKDKAPSVSLTLLMASFIGVLVAAVLHMTGVVHDTSVMVEVFYANVVLYFGRKISGKSTSTDSATNP